MDVPSHVNVLMPRQSQAGSHRDQGSNSASGIVSTLVPTLLIAVAGFTVFLLFRKKLQRVYEPRTMTSLVPQHQKVHRAQGTLFGWIPSMRSTKDADILKIHSMDAYLWLRFLKMLTIISFAGACLTWPILFPVNATGGGGQSELDVLSFSNVVNANRYYAHALVAWLFLGFTVFVISRERVFYVGLRQAYYLSPLHAMRLSTRTVLFLTVPEDHLSMRALREDFPNARKIWMVPDCKDLEEMVEDRDKEWQNLEKAQTKIMQGALKKNSKETTDMQNLLKGVKTPTHRLKPVIGKKVETIPYSRGEMVRLGEIIQQLQEKAIDNKGRMLPAAFVEFENQIDAQKALQFSFTGARTQWNPRHIGVQPGEVIWKNLGTTYKSRKAKMLIASIIIYLIVLFWTIPVAVIGAISNINYLTDRVPFLGFINDIPPVILGVVTGLLPVVLLAALMAFVPIFCRLLAKFAGAATLSEVELKTQTWYFVFQVVQVFLVTTFASGAASVVAGILNNPGSAVTLLAENLPRASNFYLSYFILQGLVIAMLQFLNIVPFLMFQVLGMLDKTPRKKYTRWMTLQGLAWGSLYPKITNLGVIALAYSIIAPLVLGFATIGFALFYIGFRYNFLFVYGIKVDMKGESYCRAMKQLMTGVYLSTICLIGLFAIKAGSSRASVGPLVLMIIFLVALVLWQVLLDRALAPLEQYLPIYRLEKNQYSNITAKRVEEVKPVEQSDQPQNRANSSTDSLPVTTTTGGPSQNYTGNAFSRFIHPYVDSSYESHRTMLENAIGNFDDPERYTAEDIDVAYQNPALSAESVPTIWIPKDRLGLSDKFVAENREAGLKSTNDKAWFDTKDKVQWGVDEIEKCPIYEEPKTW